MEKRTQLSIFTWKSRSLLVLLLVVFFFTITGCQPAEERKALRLGDKAPDFAIKDIDGGVVVLSSLQGQGVILRFFETNCRFCKADTPAFVQFAKKIGEDNLTVLYVGSFFESEESLRNFAEEQGVNFPVAVDRDGKLAELYDVRGYPQTLFIGKEMELLAGILGGVGTAELEEIMGKHLLAQKN